MVDRSRRIVDDEVLEVLVAAVGAVDGGSGGQRPRGDRIAIDIARRPEGRAIGLRAQRQHRAVRPQERQLVERVVAIDEAVVAVAVGVVALQHEERLKRPAHAAVGGNGASGAPRAARGAQAGERFRALGRDRDAAAEIGVAALHRERSAHDVDVLDRFRDQDVEVGVVRRMDRRYVVHRHAIDEIGDVAAMLRLGITAQRDAIAKRALAVVGHVEPRHRAEEIAIGHVGAPIDRRRIDAGARGRKRADRGGQIVAGHLRRRRRQAGRKRGPGGGRARRRRRGAQHGPRCRPGTQRSRRRSAGGRDGDGRQRRLRINVLRLRRMAGENGFENKNAGDRHPPSQIHASPRPQTQTGRGLTSSRFARGR